MVENGGGPPWFKIVVDCGSDPWWSGWLRWWWWPVVENDDGCRWLVNPVGKIGILLFFLSKWDEWN